MRDLPIALAATVIMGALWALALDELARQPVTHTGTQPTTHLVR